VRAGGSYLLLHETEDDFCPCPLDSCAGKIPNGAAAEVFAYWCVHSSLTFGGNLFMQWSVFVIFAATTWTTSWVIVSAVMLFCGLVVQEIFSPLPTLLASHPPMSLAKRLRYRAVLVVLRDLVHRSREATEKDARPVDSLHTEQYVIVHRTLSRTWMTYLIKSSHSRQFFVTIVLLSCLWRHLHRRRIVRALLGPLFPGRVLLPPGA